MAGQVGLRPLSLQELRLIGLAGKSAFGGRETGTTHRGDCCMGELMQPRHGSRDVWSFEAVGSMGWACF